MKRTGVSSILGLVNLMKGLKQSGFKAINQVAERMFGGDRENNNDDEENRSMLKIPDFYYPPSD